MTAAILALSSPAPSKTAVLYLRVSTADQATRGGRDEGFSLPAQREANTRKATSLDASVIAEFVDASESGTKMEKRDGLREMLTFVREHRVDCCIVHKLDRLARSRADDVSIHFALKQAGVTLVSTSENIDETPSGMLMHDMMNSIAEFYSNSLANEVTKGMVQKAALGGTVTRAPLGYKNVHLTDDLGRINRTVQIDAERATSSPGPSSATPRATAPCRCCSNSSPPAALSPVQPQSGRASRSPSPASTRSS